VSRSLTLAPALTTVALVALAGCGGGGAGASRDPLPQPIVERADECVWGDGLRDSHRGPSPVASERSGTCERQHDGNRWRGCVHLDLTRVGCINGCSECLAHIVGDESSMPRAVRFDHCWPGPDPGHAGFEAGCSVAFGVDVTGWSAGTLHPFPAPTYHCELTDGVCTEVPWPADPPEATLPDPDARP
jgi:hypothetical protein